MSHRIPLFLTLALMLPTAVWAQGDGGHYKDYPSLVGGVTAQMRQALSDDPGCHIDSVMDRVVGNIGRTPSGRPPQLAKPGRKHLTPTQVYDKGLRSSLVFGKMEYVPFANADSAFSNASAVALTTDGICATNYHVISDIALRGALDYKTQGDKARFVMDHEGNAYPMTDLLAIDPINDLAIIKVDTRGRELTPAALGHDLNPGERVYCLSNTTGNYFHFTDGQVANCTYKPDKRSGREQYILEITADYGVGASGGPIYDECGNLAALVSSTLSIYANPQKGTNFQMAYKQTVPVFLIRRLLNNL